ANPELHPQGKLRGSGSGSIILTDSQIDHCTGMLNLREGCPHHVWCTAEVHADLTSGFPIFTMLQLWNGGLVHHAFQLAQPFSVAVCPALRFT
ncbi:MBL fold metallo-hydrolase, partial [Erwinia amylovora]|uniref:MBL fold metallo-hydrolase n=1 Tax=Erwinia amylovora TaxID=552 RepID=UPI0020BF030D